MLGTMEKPWYRNFFSHSQKPDQDAVAPSADSGSAEVQFGMGLKFANGKGVDQDYVQAATWYRKAAEQSHALAQFNLGTMYAAGQGVAQDEAASAVWFDKAAHLGDAGAQFNLGKSCHRASFRGQAKDAPEARIEAYKWYRLAAAQGYRGSDAAGTALIANMTREDVVAGDRRVAAFTVTAATVVQS
jgi:hypothetical protein